jgi:hypothetical protein
MNGQFCLSLYQRGFYDSYVTPSMRARDSFAAKSYLSSIEFVESDMVGAIEWSHGAIAVLTIVDAALRTKEFLAKYLPPPR